MHNSLIERFASLPLHAQVEQLAQVDAKTRQELILSAPHSLALTRALSPEMLLYTLKEVGLADSLELLALAAPHQIRDMLDLDCWRKDRLDDRRLISWLMLLDEAGSGKLAEWALHTDIEVLVLLVKRHLEVVRKVEVEDDPNFDHARYFTFDDQYLLRFVGEEEPILQLLLERLRVLDYNCYRGVLENSLFELESGLEEEALRWRNARLADRGYPSYDEASELFRFIPPESIRIEEYRRQELPTLRFADDEEVIPPNHALMLLDVSDSFLVRVLAGLPPDVLEQVGQELAYLANRVVVVEAGTLGELAAVRRCVALTHDYINIGLAFFADSDESVAARLVREVTLRPFFQAGVSLILQLQHQARRLGRRLQESGVAYWLDYLDSPFQETWVGVQRRPPRFFLGLITPGEILYRGFRTLTEVRRVEEILTQIPLWIAVMQRWGLLSGERPPVRVTLTTLWNTAFARWIIEERAEVRPLNRADLRRLQRRVQGERFAEDWDTFFDLVALRFRWTAEETAAMRTLVAHAQDKLRAAVAVEVAAADLRFVEGVLVTE
jgi:hypothetical protein